jgi:hypothetical protein
MPNDEGMPFAPIRHSSFDIRHPVKVALARPLRKETTVSLKWTAETLCIGTLTHLSNLLRPARQSTGSVKDKDPWTPFPQLATGFDCRLPLGFLSTIIRPRLPTFFGPTSPVIGPRAFQSVASRLLYTPKTMRRSRYYGAAPWAEIGRKAFVRV